MNELIEDLKPALYDWCEEENHLDLHIAAEEDFSQPHIWLRFLDDVMNFNKWYAAELRYLDERIDIEKVQHFVDTLPKGHDVLEKIMVSKVGFSQSAIVMAGQLGIRCLNFAQNEMEYYGCLVSVVSTQTIDSPEARSQREWQQIHTHLEDSRNRNSTIDAIISDPNSDQSYTWDSLEVALPVATPYDTATTYTYPFLEHSLLITGFEPLQINSVQFKYLTTFQALDAHHEAEALAELLGQVILE